jgi:MIP family channel proteins
MAESRTTDRRDLSGTFATPAEQPTRAEAAAAIAPTPLAQAVAELLGTFALIYVGVMVLVTGAPALFQNGTKDLLAVALAHGLTIAVMVSATMQISGGQLNPAVTVGLAVARKLPMGQAGINIVAQILGGALGGWAAKASLGGASIKDGIPALGQGVGTGRGILIEAILTFFLVFVVFGTGVDQRFGARLGGTAIGFTVALDILAGGPLTGAAMNPARWLGPAIIQGTYANIAVYLIGPVVGGVLAALIRTDHIQWCFQNVSWSPNLVHPPACGLRTRSRSKGRSSHREAHLPPPWPDGRSGTFRQGIGCQGEQPGRKGTCNSASSELVRAHISA